MVYSELFTEVLSISSITVNIEYVRICEVATSLSYEES